MFLDRLISETSLQSSYFETGSVRILDFTGSIPGREAGYPEMHGSFSQFLLVISGRIP
jgi:hypothetical protein